MPMQYPVKLSPTTAEEDMPPPPDVSLPVKPSGGERFSEILEEAEFVFGGQLAISPTSIRMRSAEDISCRLKDDIEELLTFEMNDLCQRLLPSPESEQLRARFVAKLQSILDIEWPDKNITVHLFGSSTNGLGTLSSDVDICLTTPWDDRINGVANMHVLAAALQKHGMEGVNTVAKAKVPICKFYDPEYHVNCDINVNNTIALRNTRLIKTYVDIDPRVKPLMLVIKHWTRQRALNDAAKGGTLSTYCWTMMVLNFLQMRQPPILPCLHTMYFEQLKADPHKVKPVIVDGVDCSFFENLESVRGFGQKNNETLASLLFGFFRRYAVEFNYEAHVISVRHGRYLTKEEKGWNLDVERTCRFLCVEEPFNPQRNLANSADAVSVAGLRKEFDRALSILEKGEGLEAACEPYIPLHRRIPISNLGPLLMNGHRTYLNDIGRNAMHHELYGWRKYDAYQSQLSYDTRGGHYGYKTNGQPGNFFYTNHPPYAHTSASAASGPDPRSNGCASLDNGDRRLLAGLNLMRGGAPHITPEDIHRLSSLQLESRHLENHRVRPNYYSYASERRAAEIKRRGVTNVWATPSQPRDRNGASAPAGSLYKKATDVGGKKDPEKAEKMEKTGDVGHSSPRSPIQVYIEKQSDGDDVKEVIISEIGSDGRSRTLSCERADTAPDVSLPGPLTHHAPEPLPPEPSKTLRSPPEQRVTSAAESQPQPKSSHLQPHNHHNGRRSPVHDRRDKSPNGRKAASHPETLSVQTKHNGHTSPSVPERKTKSEGRISPKKHVSHHDHEPERDRRRRSPTKHDAPPEMDRDWHRPYKPHSRQHSDEHHMNRSYPDVSRREGHLPPGDTTHHPKRRGSKGILLWANHSQRMDTLTTTTTSRKPNLNGLADPPKQEDEQTPVDNRRGREAYPRDKHGRDPKAWTRPRSLSASAAPKSPWQDVRSAKSPDRINSARAVKRHTVEPESLLEPSVDRPATDEEQLDNTHRRRSAPDKGNKGRGRLGEHGEHERDASR
ncbi:uncharacterized protein SPPG_06761 [Spizellomyces punctatus DAOM BR117]|uniref:polynucleotide adenylyltransferase n=1 Tax=Spizellomyces punctatus (strain DAOM BR117) TaxID=645134 RepID=A0A0L0H9S0_SPIPD|nr:uncharacterized protein SPPG_06761 [Spizellomyces punctatus DAOM BR117]KNC97761.1 hypothetical protein SPPG_06761 [Spizellomyces punctatus DAOM BR117]|eukprot:XP_016605801.1 hypothetical protein SPPG_06761 [Spizellomyces punctatus DAOM BR117]